MKEYIEDGSQAEVRYPFRDEETAELHWLSFEEMMQADVMGCIELGGRVLRRARDLERDRVGGAVNDPPPLSGGGGPGKPEHGHVQIVSDALGFPEAQLGDFERDRKLHGMRGVEFTRDPDVPQFIQVRCDSREAYLRYAKHRGMFDKSHVNGSKVVLSGDDLERARRRVLERYPVKSGGEDIQLAEEGMVDAK